MKRILIVKLWALGDILMATPLLTALKKQWPDCEITWLADTGYADILRDNPLLNEVIAFDAGKWRRHFRRFQILAYGRMSRRLSQDLRRRGFDVVITLTAEKWWSVWFQAAPVRIGLFPSEHPGGIARLYTTAIPRSSEPRLHNSQHYLLPAAALGIPGTHDEHLVLGVSPEARQATRRFLEAQPNFDPRRPLVVLHPGASQASKRWPAQNFAAVASDLQSRYNVVITGSPSERALAEAVQSALPSNAPPLLIAAGTLGDIRETVALIEMAAVVVTGDTSALHIASALQTPVVGLYGSTRPRDYAPQFGPRALLFDDTVPCAPCDLSDCPLKGDAHMQCQRVITPQAVQTALNSLLRQAK